jgi:hypothetical protein
MKHFFLNFGEHLLLKHLVEALDRRLPALPRPLVLGLLAVDRADRRQRLGAGVILGDRGLLGQPIDPVARRPERAPWRRRAAFSESAKRRSVAYFIGGR